MSFRTARERAGLRAAEVAAAIGVSCAAVYYWEDGTAKPTTDNLIKLSKLYGCTIDDLLKEE